MEVFSRKVNTDVESAISPNEKYFALTLFESKKVEIVNLEDGKSIFLEFQNDVFSLCFNSRNELFVSSFEKVYWYDSNFEKCTIILQSNNDKRSINAPIEGDEYNQGPNPIVKMKLSPKETYLAVGYINGKITLFKFGEEYGSYIEFRTIEAEQEFGGFQGFSLDEKVICCSDEDTTFYSVETGEIAKRFPADEYGWGNSVFFGNDRILIVPRDEKDLLSVLLDSNYNKICNFEHVDNMHFDSVKNIVVYECDDKRIEWDANGRLLRILYFKDFVETQVGSLSHIIEHLEKEEVWLHRIVRNYERVSSSKPEYKSQGPDRCYLRMNLLNKMQKTFTKDELEVISDLEEFNFKGVKKFQTHQEKVFKEKDTEYLRKVNMIQDMIKTKFFTITDKIGLFHRPFGLCFDKNGNLTLVSEMQMVETD
jgi:hypothetical protein